MNLNFLEFEQPIAELEAKIEELRNVSVDSDVNISEEIERLEGKSRELTKSIFSKLTPWQKVQLARHPQRKSSGVRRQRPRAPTSWRVCSVDGSRVRAAPTSCSTSPRPTARA